MLSVLRIMSPALLLFLAARADAFESRWTSGLSVATERLTGNTAVNGVSFRVQRATGRDVPVLADRMLGDWQRESGNDRVLALNAVGWNLFSRIHGGESEVVQWRGTGEDAELLWSIADLREVNIPPAGTIPSPRSCRMRPSVHGNVQGRRFIQTSGSCPGSVSAIATQMRRTLSAKGWRLHQHGDGVLQAERDNQRAQIVLAPAASGANLSQVTDVVILELGLGAKAQ